MDKLVADWANVSLLDVGDMDLIRYLQLRRDAFISKLNATEAGREYLDNAWLLSRTEPDRKSSRELIGSRR